VELRVLKQDELMLVTDELGDIPSGRRRLGFYRSDTRYLSVFELSLNRSRTRFLASSCRQNSLCDFQLANPTVEAADGPLVPMRTVGVERHRFIEDGLHEQITLYNYNPFPVTVELGLVVGADFLDMYELRGYQRMERGTIGRPKASDSQVVFPYVGQDRTERLTTVVFATPPASLEVEERPGTADTRASTVLPESTDVTSAPGVHHYVATATWRLTLDSRRPLRLNVNVMATEREPATQSVPYNDGLAAACARFDDWSGAVTKITTDNELFNELLERSLLDLALLLECTPEGRVPNAGVPWFACVYGAQGAIASLQTLSLDPRIAVATLRHLARHQGTEVVPSRDEEPGKIVHEMRKGELSRTGEIPLAAFYGGVSATPLFLILFAETMKWLDDDVLYADILPAAKAALEWLWTYGDADGDGYIEYTTRSTGGMGQGGWLDGRGVVVHGDSTMAERPVALAEVQGYAYRAMKEMAALLSRKGERRFARKIDQKADALKRKFNRDFWLEGERYIAQALDGRKRPIPNITSSAARALFCDIVDEDKARYVVTRLSSPEMLTGWGIRNLSGRAQNFNPMSYRHGSVWPHDNSLIVAGMKRYGYHWEVEEIVSQLLDASTFFPNNQLPELFAGFRRDRKAYSVPAEYPASCRPHACASATVFLLLQALLGLQADAAAKRIYLSARLPKWLRRASLEGLRVGDKSLSLHFDRARDDDETRFEISDNEAGVEVVIPPR
jgi:glycogen debranching enzyme